MVVPEALSPVERIQRCQTLADARWLVPGSRRFLTIWDPEAQGSGTSYTFEQFWRLADRYSIFFGSRKLDRKAIVALILPHGVDLMAAFAGAILGGVIPTILAFPNFKIHPEKYRQGLAGVTANIRPSLVVLDRSFPEEFAGHLSADDSTEILRLDSRLLPDTDSQVPPRIDPDDVALVQHSAGTTGLQKGVALKHRVVLGQLKPLAKALQMEDSDRIASWLPLYHDMGLIACFLLPLVAGIPVVMQSPVEWVMRPVTFLEIISDFRCTLGWVPNFTFQFLARRVDAGDRGSLDLSCLKALTTTSEPIRFHSLREFGDAFAGSGLAPGAIQSSYGMAESVFAVTQSRLGVAPTVVFAEAGHFRSHGQIRVMSQPGAGCLSFVSCGFPLGSNLIKVLSADGVEQPEGTVGEIWVRTDYLFDGYHNRPDLTEEVLRGGWYRTNDAGFLLGGELFVIGRLDDTIIVGGRNFYPQDIEEVAFSHPLIQDGRAVALGIENPSLGTAEIVVVAEVGCAESLQHAQRITAEIRQDIVESLGVSPRYVVIVEPRWLIKSTAGKPARSANREKLLRERPELMEDPGR